MAHLVVQVEGKGNSTPVLTLLLSLHQQRHKLVDDGQVHVSAVVARDQDLALHVQDEYCGR